MEEKINSIKSKILDQVDVAIDSFRARMTKEDEQIEFLHNVAALLNALSGEQAMRTLRIDPLVGAYNANPEQATS